MCILLQSALLSGFQKQASHKAGLLNLAEELSNVSKACKIMGVSR
ncbi:helix-turn-helix domain-containing protein, partial [Salmonella enterica subsp. enterica serovar Brazzaville]|nr:helix-turn-helix domain-containing protein [Salmonella enterica subsp. enterica serovar Brazzaville]